MAQRTSLQLRFYKNDPKGDVNKTWKHDLYEQYEALFKAAEKQSPNRRHNNQPPQINFSDPKRNATNYHQPPQMNWSDLERNAANSLPTRINLFNLDEKVSNDDLYDLFSLIGDLRDVQLDCDEYGRSKGTASIIFERKVDAIEAMQRYNGCLLDNKTLKMELMHNSTLFPVFYKNTIANNIQSDGSVTQSHTGVQSVADDFNSLKIT